MNLVQKIFGTHSERELKRIEGTVQAIENLRPSMQALSDEELRGKTEQFKKDLPRAKHWTICSPKLLRRCGKPHGVCLIWNTTGFS